MGRNEEVGHAEKAAIARIAAAALAALDEPEAAETAREDARGHAALAREQQGRRDNAAGGRGR